MKLRKHHFPNRYTKRNSNDFLPVFENYPTKTYKMQDEMIHE